MKEDVNAALCLLSRIWKWNGDSMTCTGCNSSLIASRDGEEINHNEGCKHAGEQHPWRRLRDIVCSEERTYMLTALQAVRECGNGGAMLTRRASGLVRAACKRYGAEQSIGES